MRVEIAEKRFSRSWCQRSRSQSDNLGNLVPSIDPEPLKGLEPKHKTYPNFIVVGRRADYVFKVMGSEVKVTDTFEGGGI